MKKLLVALMVLCMALVAGAAFAAPAAEKPGESGFAEIPNIYLKAKESL